MNYGDEKHMKKALIILLGIALVISMFGVVSGAEEVVALPEPGQASGSATLAKDILNHDDTMVYYTAEESYAITIPEYVRFGQTEAQKTVTTVIKSSTVTLLKDHRLNLTVKSEHNWNIASHSKNANGDEVADPTKTIPYELTYNLNGAPVTLKSESGSGPHAVMLVPTGSVPITTELVFKLNGYAPETGTYKDTLTFTVNVEFIPQQQPQG